MKTITTSPDQQYGTATEECRLFVKFAGSKQQLLAQYEAFFPDRLEHYFEPFTEGGAAFFHFLNTGRFPEERLLFDNNHRFVNAYQVIRDDLQALLDLHAIHTEQHDKEYYYQIRNLDRQGVELSGVDQVACTVYLNKTCNNGLSREPQEAVQDPDWQLQELQDPQRGSSLASVGGVIGHFVERCLNQSLSVEVKVIHQPHRRI